MNIIDFTKGVGYKVIRFPDGEVHLQIDELNRKEAVKVIMRIRNAEDLFLLMQLSDILHRQEVVVEELHIPYLMSMRCDRVFSFDRPYSLKIVANVVKNVGANRIYIYEPHSYRSIEFTKCIDRNPSEDFILDYAKSSTICYPDKGAQDRYDALWLEIDALLCEKVRNVDTGVLEGFKVVNPEVFNGGEITLVDDLCDGGGTFIGLTTHLRKLNPTKLRLIITHAVQQKGIENVAKHFDEVIITNSYADWDTIELPDNVKVVNVLPKVD